MPGSSAVSVILATFSLVAPFVVLQPGLAIYGTVRVPGTREPVAGARVLIEPGPDSERALVTADAEGRFQVTDLGAGEYEVTPLRPGSADRDEGGRSGRTETVRLASGELPPDIVLWLPPSGRVSGRVTGPEGEPLEDMEVSLWRLGWSGEPTLLLAPGAPYRGPRTDEDGRYEMYAQPGEYYVEVRDVSPDAFPRHYYPGVLYPEDAARVTLRAGSDLTGIDIRIRDTDLFRVRFSLDPPMLPGLAEHPSAYLPEGASLIGAIIRPLGPGRIAMGRLPYALSLEQIDDDTWMFGQLLGAGDYNVSLGYSSALFGAFRQREFDPDLQRSLEGHARIVNTRITVDADEADETGNVDLGTIPVSPRVSAEGRVVVRPLGRGSIDLTSLRLTIGLTRVRADGTFLLQDRLPGRYGFRFAPDSIPEGWYVESASSGGRDVLREGLELTGRPAPIQVVIAEGAGRIEGTVRNADGELLPGARVVLILPSHRRGSLLRFPTATADAAGRYVLDGIPPGEYRLLALDEAGTVVPTPSVLAPDLYWESPDFLRRNELRGERITLDPGARLSIHPEAILLDDP